MKQTTSVTSKLVADPAQQTSGSQEKGLGLIDGIIRASNELGGEMADGTASIMLTAVGSIVEGNNLLAADARRR